MKNQGWGRKFEVKGYGTSYDYPSLGWFGTFHNLPRIGWYFSSQFLYSPANHHLLSLGSCDHPSTDKDNTPKIRVENAEEMTNVQCFGYFPHEIEKAY